MEATEAIVEIVEHMNPPRSRNQRSIQGAKYARDIQKNQKKLDKAIASGNAKKIAKFSKADTILKTNRNIMLKDLSYDEIKMGEDYLKTMKNMSIGFLFGGVIGGTAAGLYTRNKLGSAETEKNIRAQDKARADKFFMEEMNPGRDLSKDSEYNRLSKEAKGESQKPTAVMVTSSEAKKLGLDDSTKFTEKESSDFWKAYAKQAESSAKNDSGNKFQEAKSQAAIKDRVSQAKKTNKFDMEFLEQNGDLDPRTGDQLKGKELYDAYEKWLKENQ